MLTTYKYLTLGFSGHFENGFLLKTRISSKTFQFCQDIKDPKFLTKTFEYFSGYSWIVDHAICQCIGHQE